MYSLLMYLIMINDVNSYKNMYLNILTENFQRYNFSNENKHAEFKF